MKDEDKPKESLLKELQQCRERINELEAVEARHKRDEEALREREEWFRSVVEYSHEGIFVVDDSYRFIYCNSSNFRVSS